VSKLDVETIEGKAKALAGEILHLGGGAVIVTMRAAGVSEPIGHVLADALRIAARALEQVASKAPPRIFVVRARSDQAQITLELTPIPAPPPQPRALEVVLDATVTPFEPPAPFLGPPGMIAASGGSGS
jgi:hypothetical protein